MHVPCPRCSHFISAQPGRLPPWCPKCGTDLKDCPITVSEPEASTTPTVDQQQRLVENLRERFTRHNFAVGAVLAIWGLLIGVGGQPSNLDKLLRDHSILALIMTAIQWLTLANGGLLFYSGMGVRAQRPWGVSLAAASAVASIVLGVVFLGVFWYLGTFSGLENSVARVNYATGNLNLLGGLVDGIGLLVFLHRHGAPDSPAAKP